MAVGFVSKPRKVELDVVPTPEAVESFRRAAKGTNAILHVTCERVAALQCRRVEK